MQIETKNFEMSEAASRAKKVKQFNDATKPVQALFLIIGFVAGAIAFYYYVQELNFKNELSQYENTFPYKKELEIAASLGPGDFVMKYGIEASDKLYIISGSHRSELNYRYAKISKYQDSQVTPFIICLISFFLLAFLEFAIRRPHVLNILHGKMQHRSSKKVSFTSKIKERLRPVVTGREGLTSFSVADELMKWTALRDNGTVSEDEYQAARQRLLKA